LDAIEKGLLVVLQQTDKLASEHIGLIVTPKDSNTKDSKNKDAKKDVKDPKEEKRKQWLEVLTLLDAARATVNHVNKTYSLTPGESAELQKLIDEKEAEFEAGHQLHSGQPSKASGSESPAKTSATPLPAKPSGEPAKPPAANSTAAPQPAKH
jgi:hypothetical protein